MRQILERVARAVQQVPRHPEVDQENSTALEPNNEILAAPLHGRDAFSLELRCHLHRVVGTDEARVVDGDAVEATTDERGFELPPNALDLR